MPIPKPIALNEDFLDFFEAEPLAEELFSVETPALMSRSAELTTPSPLTVAELPSVHRASSNASHSSVGSSSAVKRQKITLPKTMGSLIFSEGANIAQHQIMSAQTGSSSGAGLRSASAAPSISQSSSRSVAPVASVHNFERVFVRSRGSSEKYTIEMSNIRNIIYYRLVNDMFNLTINKYYHSNSRRTNILYYLKATDKIVFPAWLFEELAQATRSSNYKTNIPKRVLVLAGFYIDPDMVEHENNSALIAQRIAMLRQTGMPIHVDDLATFNRSHIAMRMS
jgi:hypothetical protein